MSEPVIDRHTQRRLVAERIRTLRDYERQERTYPASRSAEEYIGGCLGLKHFFDYIRTIKTSNTVIDIGAGTTRAISQIANSDMGKGLQFKATVLDRKKQTDIYLGHANVTTTSAEILRGIQDESVAGMLAIVSIGYSVAPEMAAQRIDKALVPGGAIKAVFGTGIIGIRRLNEFSSAWKNLGYDIARETKIHGVLLAIKPGIDKNTTAKNLFEQDSRDPLKTTF